jgi:hypothetical protein
LPLKQALEYGIEIAEALERPTRTALCIAIEARNCLMLTKSGAKLLDFQGWRSRHLPSRVRRRNPWRP